MNITEDRLKYLEEQINEIFECEKYEFRFDFIWTLKTDKRTGKTVLEHQYKDGDLIGFRMNGNEYTFNFQISPFMTLSYIGEALQKDGVIQNFRICGTTKEPWIEMLVRKNNDI
jgi:hypothetical protein